MPSGKASSHLRQGELAADQLQKAQGQQFVHQQTYEIIHSPLPDPEMLERYKNTDPSFPERIMRMAEAHSEADIITKNRISLSGLVIPILGKR
ncbi:MAG: DUF2335 domain-containing protein [Spirochaetes bacterium]|nr:DUF2335 domain-containing protein [Spirochaetota bacterium]